MKVSRLPVNSPLGEWPQPDIVASGAGGARDGSPAL
jgi:hypothetical protein